MKNQDFTTTTLVDQTAKEVFNAINNVRGWWSEEIEGSTNKLNDEWTYHYEDVHNCKMKIVEFIPNKKVVWLVTDNYFSFTKDKSEWKGNKIIFEISEKDNKTQLHFSQIGLVPEYECYDICQNAWSTYIQESLRSLISTGKGQPNAKSKPQTDFTTIILVSQTPTEVFNAVNNVRGWWQGEIGGNTNKLNDEFTYRVEEIHFSKQKVVEIIPDKKVVWLVTDSKLNFTKDKSEWTGTKISFEISEINNKTQLRFTHTGLVPKIECYGACSNAWGQLIQQSLFSLITTGKGKKIF
jgi:hypothetical protein